jgi:hypothetical protein
MTVYISNKIQMKVLGENNVIVMVRAMVGDQNEKVPEFLITC